MNAIIPFAAGLPICSFACDLSAETPQIRVSIQAKGENGNDAKIVSALSREFRKLDGISVTDTQPALKIVCVVIRDELVEPRSGDKIPLGYAASAAIVNGVDNRFLLNLVHTDATIDRLAHEIAIETDGTIIEPMRRAAQPSSSP